jgi:hypothetical protein
MSVLCPSRLGAVDVVKRLNYAEVDKLIVCCSQHVRGGWQAGDQKSITI